MRQFRKSSTVRAVTGALAILLGACGSSDSGGTTTLTYSDTVKTYASDGINSSATGKTLSDAYNDFLLFDAANSTDPNATDVKATAFVTAFTNYNTSIQNLQSYAATTFGISPTTNDISVAKAPGTIGTTSGQTLASLQAKLEAKKADCDVILANYNSLTDPVAKALKLADYDKCAAALQAEAAAEGFKITVVKAAGGIVGAAAVKGVLTYVGLAGVYFIGGATVTVSAPAAAVVIIASSIAGGIIGSKAAGAIYDYCTSGSGTTSKGSRAEKSVGTTEYCSISSTSGITGAPMTLVAAPGTGTLQVFVDGYAPASIAGVTVAQGQTVTVNVTLVPLTSVTDSSSGDITTANNQTTDTSATTTASSCSDVVSITAANTPTAPAAGQSVAVTATLVPAISGCTIPYSVAGTDGYTQSASPTSNGSGQISFTIPGGAANVHDVVNISESASAVDTTLAYTFQ